MRVFGLFVLVVIFFVGCSDVLSPPEREAGGAHVLVVHIAGDVPAVRTAMPSMPSPAVYDIDVTRLGVSLGGVTGDTNEGPFHIQLSRAPAAGDVVRVEGFAGLDKWAEGSYTLPPEYAGKDVAITLSVFQAGTGNVDLKVSFPLGSDDDEITAAELSLYGSMADYRAGNAYDFKRYRKPPDTEYGVGDDLLSTIPISYPAPGIPSGNYVVQIDFFRSKYVRVSRLVQTIIVRDNLTTNSWNGGGDTLALDETDFASSSADLRGLSISNAPASFVFSPTNYAYTISEAVTEAPGTESLTVDSKPGQAIAVSLNGVDMGSGSSFSLPMKAANSIVIAVTAPDGVTKQTYTVSYTYYNQTEWYVKAGGDDSKSGKSDAEAMATVGAALTKITASYSLLSPVWPGKDSNPSLHNPVAARISIKGTIKERVNIDTGTAPLPPVLLEGYGPSDTGTINANSSGRPLTINKAVVILGDNITLTGGFVSSAGGGGVLVKDSGSFTMNGGTISGNRHNSASGTGGGGVFVQGGSVTMNGGTNRDNTNDGYSGDGGGGVFVKDAGEFTMNGGTIKENRTFDANGGGVYVTDNSSRFTMNGGTISKHTGDWGGGVYVSAGGEFIMNVGHVSENHSNEDGGGVYVTGSNSSFTMNGGTISKNTTAASKSGGGVFFSSGGGTFAMSGGTISGNTAAASGGGVWVSNSSVFTMSGGIVSGNIANDNGGGVCFTSGTFNMSAGSISGNTAANKGGGMYKGGGSFNMSGGTISGNTGSSSGGGVHVTGGGVFNMEAGVVISQDNDVWLAAGKMINITDALTGTPYAARITPESYSPLPQVLSGSGTLDPNYLKFTVTPYSGTNYTINSGGYLQVQP
jgi:hypothetical protein